MGFYFKAKLSEAEKAINALVKAIDREGGSVYISELDDSGFCSKLTGPIKITYWLPANKAED